MESIGSLRHPIGETRASDRLGGVVPMAGPMTAGTGDLRAAARRAGLSPAASRSVALPVAALLLGALAWAVRTRHPSGPPHRSETPSRALFEAALDPVLVLDGRRSGRITEANRAAQAALGLAPDGVGPDGDRPRLGDLAVDPQAADAHLLAARQTGHASDVLELRHPDGAVVPSAFASALRGDGDATAVVSIARDATARRRDGHRLVDGLEGQTRVRGKKGSGTLVEVTLPAPPAPQASSADSPHPRTPGVAIPA
ncbi:MAG: PAS domain-containing protein [Bacteroidota bacterium]